MYRNPNPAGTKTLKWRQPNKRNVSGSSITIHFHSRWDKKTYLETQKMFEISQTWFAAWTRVRINSFSHAKANAWVFPTSFAVILSAVALPIVLKAEFNFELIFTLPSFFLSPGSCFKSSICHIQNTDRPVFVAVEGWKNYSQEKCEGSVHLDFHSEAT